MVPVGSVIKCKTWYHFLNGLRRWESEDNKGVSHLGTIVRAPKLNHLFSLSQICSIHGVEFHFTGTFLTAPEL